MTNSYQTHVYCPYCRTWIYRSLIIQQEGRKKCPLCHIHRVRLKAKCKNPRAYRFTAKLMKTSNLLTASHIISPGSTR